MNSTEIITLIIGVALAVIGWWTDGFTKETKVFLTVLVVIVVVMILLFNRKIIEDSPQESGTTTTSNETTTPARTEAKSQKRLIRKGDIYCFGNYEQNQEKSGKEPIEWVVYAINSQYVFLISRHVLDVKLFHNSSTSGTTYDKSDVRKWLNNEFLQIAFTDEEQDRLIAMDVEVPHNYTFPNTAQGKEVKDKVALLSINEVRDYFPTEASRLAMGTPYAFANGLFQGESGFCPWWTRTMGKSSQQAAIVKSDGVFNEEGWWLTEDWIGIRPCIQLELDYVESWGE